ncbi:MAG: NAD-binding protein [Streptosporangiales bacterium]|nr:NAD-binding protein [Streptosporangiales bacterium]
MTEVAFLGLGRMGAPMARRLVETGHELVVWNRTASRAKPLVDDGVEVGRRAADAVADADVVLTMLADPAAVLAVVDQIAGGMRPGSCLVDLSSIGPGAVAEVRRRLPESVGLVDAPVMGSVDRAAIGGLTVLAGGDRADLDRVDALLADLGQVVRCGALGQGAATKLVLATAIFAAVPLVGEALRLARWLGVDHEQVTGLLATSPVGGVVARAAYEPAEFAVDLAAKDLALAVAAVPDLTITAAAEARLRGVAARGLGDHDLRHAVESIRAGD